MLVESVNNFLYSLGHWIPGIDEDGDGVLDTDARLAGETYNRGIPYVHNDTSNVTMVDGHTERIPLLIFVDPDADFWHDP